MTRISISNPRRERLKAYYRLRLRRAGRKLGKALARTVRPSDGAWLLTDDIPNIDRAPMRYWEASPERIWFDLSEIPGSAGDRTHYWDVKWGDGRDDPR